MSNEPYYLPQDCDFSTVGGNSESSHECSPKLRDGAQSNFEGLVINGPKAVIWPKEASIEEADRTPLGDVIDSPLRFMITGLVRLPSNTLGLNGWLNDGVVVIAVDQQTAEAYSGKLQMLGTRPKPPPLFGESQSGSLEQDAENDSSITGSWFGMDLVNNLGIPIRNATYTVYATLGDYKSNVLTIKARIE